MKVKKIMVFGATSAIAGDVLKIFAKEGSSFTLFGRNKNRLEIVKADLEARGASFVAIELFDAESSQGIDQKIQKVDQAMGGADLALLAHGVLGAEDQAQFEVAESRKIFEVNFLSYVDILIPVADFFESRKQGSIAVISSVAGDRGRQSNYTYGSAKGALSTYLQGLRNRLAKSGVQVLTIKPGFVDTPMTADIQKNFLFASSEKVAEGIVRAIEKKKNEVYLPWFWKWIMMIIRHIPEPVFKRMNL